MRKSNTDMAVNDLVRYTRYGSTSWVTSHDDRPRNFNPDNPYGTVLDIFRDGQYPSAQVRWDHSGETSWAFLSSLLIVTEQERQTDLGWARSYLNDVIRDSYAAIEEAQRRLGALP